MALPWPENAERSGPGFRSVSCRPSPAVIGIGPSRGRCATSPTAVMPLQRASSSSAQAGTSWRTSDVGPVGAGQPDHLLEVDRRAAAARCCRGRGSSSGPASTRRLLYERRARRPRRPSRVHAAVRPRARGGARPRRAPRSSSSPRGSASARLPRRSDTPPRGLLPALVAAVPALPAATAAEGGRAPGRPARGWRACPGTSSTSSGWQRRSSTLRCSARAARRSSPLTICCRDGRRSGRTSGAVCSARFDRIVVHSERGRETLAAARRRPGASAGDPAPRVPERPAPRGRRPHGALPRARSARTRGSRDAIAAVAPGGRGAAARRRRSARAPRRVPCGRRRPGASGGSATWARRSSTARSATRRVAVFPYRAELDQSGALLRALGRGRAGGRLRRRRAGRAGARLRGGPGGARPATSTRWRRRSAGCSATRRARRGPRRRAAGARRADLGRDPRPRTSDLVPRAASGLSQLVLGRGERRLLAVRERSECNARARRARGGCSCSPSSMR